MRRPHFVRYIGVRLTVVVLIQSVDDHQVVSAGLYDIARFRAVIIDRVVVFLLAFAVSSDFGTKR